MNYKLKKKTLENKLNNWRGILKIIDIEHVRASKVLWAQKNIWNQLHLKGEEFLLNCCFNNNGNYPPSEYYFGLDSRSSISQSDTIEDLEGEPTENGYTRQPRSSNGGFIVEPFNGNYRASSNIMTFTAAGGGWGPVKNIFIATSSDGSGVLLSTAALSQEINLIDGDSVNLRMALSLS